MCSLKMHDNVLISWVCDKCEHDSLYANKVKLVNKIQAQTCKRNASKVKIQISSFNNKAPVDANVGLVFNFI